jgi:hypothetical protein
MTDEILAEVGASAPRRWLAVAMQMTLGLMLLYIAMNTPPTLGWQVFLILLGIGSLVMSVRTFNASQHRIILTREGLSSSTGEQLIALENIARVERGVFALKPSNGFMVIAKTRGAGRRWQPGLWWRLGKRVGVGGVAPGHQTKAMAQIIEALLAETAGPEN